MGISHEGTERAVFPPAASGRPPTQGTPQLAFSVPGFSEGAVYQMRIAHFEGFFADDTHGCTIRDMEIALDTVDLKAERSAYCVA